jgi:hypothetical protein
VTYSITLGNRHSTYYLITVTILHLCTLRVDELNYIYILIFKFLF